MHLEVLHNGFFFEGETFEELSHIFQVFIFCAFSLNIFLQ